MIYIDQSSKQPYYQQIYLQLLRQIQDGTIPTNTVLPGIRQLSKTLGVGRNTVDSAYGQLAAEGYIRAETGRGFRVLELPKLLPVQPVSSPVPSSTPTASAVPVKYDLFYGQMAASDFPFRLWKRELNSVLSAEQVTPINDVPGNKGDSFLREQLAEHLFETRGVRCSPQQIIITTGMQGSLDILCKLFLPLGGHHAIESPGYDKAELMFQSYGFSTIPVPLDPSGADPTALPTQEKITSLYLTPSHQLPLGIVMPIQRRYEVLNWAAQNDVWLIEDDYDSEYSYYSNPIPSLQSIDSHGRVIYLGTFSKTLSPSMRMGYLVLPPLLLTRFENELSSLNSMVPWLLQRTLANFIAHGHYQRMVRRLRTKFSKCHDILLREIRQMSPEIQVVSQGAGLMFLLDFPGNMQRTWLMKAAREHGVIVYSPERFWLGSQPCPPNLIMIGFTAIAPEDIPPCIERLKAAWFGGTLSGPA